MITPLRAIVIGMCVGIPGALGQLWLIRLNSAQSVPLRGLLSMSVAVLIGVVAGFVAKSDAVKAAALMGFVAGVFLSSVGLATMVTNPGLIGAHPFSSAETALEFVSSVMAGTVISSWIIAGFAVLIAMPISISQMKKEYL